MRSLAGLLLAACGPPRGAIAPATSPGASPPLKLDPLIDLVAAGGLVWLLDLRPHELLAAPAVRAAVAEVVPAARFEAFARYHGGVDLRALDELAIAAYPRASLALARGAIDPDRVEAAFAARADPVEGRAREGRVRRVWGPVRGEPRAVAVLGAEGVALERGAPGPLRAAVYFAEERLRRSLPALRAAPLATIAPQAGDGPIRAFAPGPFESDRAGGLAGLLRAATAVALTARPWPAAPEGCIAVRIVLSGAWGNDAGAAAERIRSAFGVLAADPLGRLTGLDAPRSGPTVSGDADAIRLEVALDLAALARGLHTVMDASLEEMMAD
ncbi:MAG: hypothetical protein JOZ69_15395 [Myxococcales bacterium]|nr:hypothetical protein [Myxococcales bacterium]